MWMIDKLIGRWQLWSKIMSGNIKEYCFHIYNIDRFHFQGLFQVIFDDLSIMIINHAHLCIIALDLQGSVCVLSGLKILSFKFFTSYEAELKEL